MMPIKCPKCGKITYFDPNMKAIQGYVGSCDQCTATFGAGIAMVHMPLPTLEFNIEVRTISIGGVDTCM